MRSDEAPTLRSDRMIEQRDARGRVVWQSSLGTFGDPQWCVYGDPCQPYRLYESDARVLWGTCGHPVDLSEGAAERHVAAYAGS